MPHQIQDFISGNDEANGLYWSSTIVEGDTAIPPLMQHYFSRVTRPNSRKGSQLVSDFQDLS